MKKEYKKIWRKRGLAAALSLALIMQSTATGFAMENTSEILNFEEVQKEVNNRSEEEITNTEVVTGNEFEEEYATEEIKEATEDKELVTEESEIENIVETTERQETVSNNETINEQEELTVFSEESGFVIDEKGVLTEYQGTESKVTIPEGVTEIGESAFFGNSTLESVVFPTTLKKIGESAFYSCTSLKEVEIPANVESIGNAAFGSCTAMEKVVLNEGLISIGDEVFAYAAFGKVNEITGQVEEYGKLTIPSTVQSMGANIFCRTKYLSEVTFANGENQTLVMKDEGIYGSGIFGWSESLTKVVLPERLTVLPTQMFQYCTKLETIEWGTKVTNIPDYACNGCASLKEVILPSTVESIGTDAFRGCTSLEKVTLNEGLIRIGDGAFREAGFGKKDMVTGEILEYGTLTIPSTVQVIDSAAFAESKYLKEVIFKNGSNENLTINYSHAYDGVFMWGESLEKVVLPERLTTIRKEMFQYCQALKTVELGSKVTKIEDCAFEHCTALENITLPEGLVSIEEYAFRDTGFGHKNEVTNEVSYGTLTIPSSVQYIGKDVFAETKYLKEIVFENGINNILVMEDGIIYDGGTFGWSKSLEKVLLPKRLQKLPDGAFYYCENLKTVYIPKTVTQITRECDNDTFDGCNKNKLVIYGEYGSEAESYAKAKGIRFNDSSVLGLFPTGITLNRRNIRLFGETAIGRTIALKAKVKPTTAQNKAVIYTSQNPAVAEVDENGVVTIKGYGETDIIVKSMEDETLSTSCHVTVLKVWTEEELSVIRKSISENNTFAVVTNVYKNLQEVEINAPGEITAQWRLPYEIGTGTKRYDIVLQKEGYIEAVLEDVEVTGVKVTGVKLNCETQVEPGKNFLANAEILTEGGSISDNDYQISFKSSNVGNVKVEVNKENPLRAVVTGVKKSSNANVITTVILNKDGKASAANKADKGITWFETSAKVKVTNYVIVDDITFDVKQAGTTVSDSHLEQLANITEKQEYTLSATSWSDGQEVADVPVTWKTSNPSVAKVKVGKDGAVTLTVAEKGTSVITATAAKNGGYAESFRVTVKDSTPRLVEKNIALNLYKVEAAEYIHILPSDGYEIEAGSLQIVNANGEAAPFEIAYANGNNYKINVKTSERANIKTGNHTVKILVKTSAKEETSHELTLKIKVEKKVPKVTVKQGTVLKVLEHENGVVEVLSSLAPGKVNLYEKNGYGAIQVLTEEKISNIRFESKTTSGPRLVEAEKSAGELRNVIVKTADVTKDNYTKTQNKGIITVTFEGYLPEAAFVKEVTLAVNKKLPVIAATPISATLYPGTLADTTEISFVNKTTGEDIFLTEGYSVTAEKTPNGYIYTPQTENTLPRIQALKTAGKAKVEYKIQNEKWIDGLSVTSKCTLKIGKVPTLAFTNKKVTFNTKYTLEDFGTMDLGAYVKGFENLKFTSLTVTGKDEKSQKVLDEEALSFRVEDGAVKGGITDGSYFAKAGNYTFNVTAYAEGKPVSGTLKVAVVLEKNAPKVSFKTKGTINLLNRAETQIAATPTIKNYTGKIVDVDLYSAYADKFKAEVQDGVVFIKAREGEVIKTKTSYTLHMYVTLDSGVRLPASLKVMPKQTNPKLVQNTKEIVLCETAKGVNFGEEFTVQTAQNQTGEIKQIRLVTENDTFAFDENTNMVYVKNTASLKPGKKYTLKFEVRFQDAGSNEKPVTVSLKVDYRK